MDINLSLLSENANILVVDDTVENLSLLTRMLKDWGYTARPVPNGRLAIQAARGKKPDLILLDINNRGHSGRFPFRIHSKLNYRFDLTLPIIVLFFCPKCNLNIICFVADNNVI